MHIVIYRDRFRCLVRLLLVLIIEFKAISADGPGEGVAITRSAAEARVAADIQRARLASLCSRHATLMGEESKGIDREAELMEIEAKINEILRDKHAKRRPADGLELREVKATELLKQLVSESPSYNPNYNRNILGHLRALHLPNGEFSSNRNAIAIALKPLLRIPDRQLDQLIATPLDDLFRLRFEPYPAYKPLSRKEIATAMPNPMRTIPIDMSSHINYQRLELKTSSPPFAKGFP